MEAAQQLGVVVHGSGLLLETALLKSVTGSLDDIPDLALAAGTGARWQLCVCVGGGLVWQLGGWIL
jgi:hypothetical protein